MERIALITGASSGIGEAMAEVLAGAGWSLIITGRRLDRLESLATRLSVPVKILTFDVRDKVATTTALESLPTAWRKIDLLVNNAGLSQGLDPVHTGNVDDWDTMIDTNVKGLLTVSRIVSQWMIQQEITGQIIHVSSTAGRDVYPNGNVYCATKHAVEAIAKGMRMELNPYGIRVSTISPGFTETEFSIVRFKGDTEKAAQVYNGFEPLQAIDIADALLFMVSRPAHVNIADLLIMPTAQGGGGIVRRK